MTDLGRDFKLDRSRSRNRVRAAGRFPSDIYYGRLKALIHAHRSIKKNHFINRFTLFLTLIRLPRFMFLHPVLDVTNCLRAEITGK